MHIARVSIHGEALDDTGLLGIDSIRGIEALPVAAREQFDGAVPASAQSSALPVALSGAVVVVLITLTIAARRPNRTRDSLSL